MKKYEFWFVVGSQFLYGPEVLETVAARAAEMAAAIHANPDIPCSFIFKGVVKTPDEATAIIKDANRCNACAGVVTWTHTFSPSKMWIQAFGLLQKPLCHFATQYNEALPDSIDMDFMNLNQAAHGDREHGFILARMRKPQKIVMGFWKDPTVLQELGNWMRSAVGFAVSQDLRVIRFGDNMRNVAVTEGDKIEAQMQLGWQVNTWPVGELAQTIREIPDAEVDARMASYGNRYEFATDDLDAVRYQARMEIAIRRFLKRENAGAFSNTFEDLCGMRQLPGLATQAIMQDGFGFGAEGDWKTAALLRVIKQMTAGLDKGSSFMEDYTYHLVPGQEAVLGAHMLEVCPSIAASKPRIEVHPLGIGGKEPPARLVFNARPGSATASTLVDMGGRFRLICQDIDVIPPISPMPNLPVARMMWKLQPDLKTAVKLWILAGGAHHSVVSFDATPVMLADWARIAGIEFVHITADTNPEQFEQQLFLQDAIWQLRSIR